MPSRMAPIIWRNCAHMLWQDVSNCPTSSRLRTTIGTVRSPPEIAAKTPASPCKGLFSQTRVDGESCQGDQHGNDQSADGERTLHRARVARELVEIAAGDDEPVPVFVGFEDGNLVARAQ